MNIILANPRGFCAGVDRAIEITNKALDIFGAPIYVKHEIVHNNYVVDELKEKGVIFIEDIETVPEHSILIYSAHGVSEKIISQSQDRKLQVFNATCPLVTKVHMEVARLSKKRVNTILIGHRGHPEVEGTMGRYVSETDSKIVLVENDYMIVVGSKNSSNSNRLKEIATRAGVPSYLLDSADDLDVKWLHNKKNIGLTAGASAPEILVQSIINKLMGFGAINVINSSGIEENITFKIPKELMAKS